MIIKFQQAAGPDSRCRSLRSALIADQTFYPRVTSYMLGAAKFNGKKNL